MKYSEFKREVEKMGFVVDDSSTPIYVDKNEDGETLMSIGRHKQFWLDPGWSGFEALDEVQKLGLYALGYKLAKTPLVEREEEKKYRVKFPAITRLGRNIYLSKEKGCVDPLGIDWSGETFIHDRPSLYTFTEQEIKDIDERYLAFKVEVKDE